MVFFVSDSAKAEHGFVGTTGTLSESASGQCSVFFRLCPRKVPHLRFSIRKIFTSKIRNDLTKPLEVNTFKSNFLLVSILNNIALCLCLGNDSHQRDALRSRHREDWRNAETAHEVCTVLHELNFKHKKNLPFHLSKGRYIWQQVDISTLGFKAWGVRRKRSQSLSCSRQSK